MGSAESIFKSEVLRYPRLDTILMIEEALRKSSGEKTARQVWKSLPRKVMWQTFTTALEYLEYSGKIMVGRSNTPIWIWNPKLMKRVKRTGVEA
ncbi:MAG TPA: hypothetical protein VJI71_03520 [Candidatus Norongarragalinales archaeon]|nr:hypothetical protein [Candidatus Norongarragalinales archaeon]